MGNSVLEFGIVLLLFFTIAFTYSTVGFGGGLGYWAVLVMFSLPRLSIFPTIYICEALSAGMALMLFAGRKRVKWKKSLVIALSGVPGTLLGLSFFMDRSVLHLVLALVLLGVAFVLFQFKKRKKEEDDDTIETQVWLPGVFFGFLTGFIGGVTKMGWGEFLAPLLLFSLWERTRKSLATVSLFIVVNALVMVVYYYASNDFHSNIALLAPMAVVVLFGSMIGANVSINYYSSHFLRKSVAMLVILAACRIFYSYLYPMVLAYFDQK